MRTRPMPIPPIRAPGDMTQYRTLGRWATSVDRSALKTMFMLPATSAWPPNGSPSCSAITLRPPSAPTRYFARISYVEPSSRSCTVAVTPSASCSNERNSVLKRSRDPRSPAARTRIGSKYVCGRSMCRHGLASA